MTQSHWYAWHNRYDDPGSWQARRLARVRERIRVALDAAPAGPVTVLDMVAGQGRDLLPVLAEHPRRAEVTARLVELDPDNCAVARATAAEAGLTGVEVVEGDAGLIDHYAGLPPADLVLICGLFAHITDDDIANVIGHLPALIRPGGTVIWTRHRRAPDAVPMIRDRYRERGFSHLWLTEPEEEFGVGAERFDGQAAPFPPGVRLFTFVGRQALRPWDAAPAD